MMLKYLYLIFASTVLNCTSWNPVILEELGIRQEYHPHLQGCRFSVFGEDLSLWSVKFPPKGDQTTEEYDEKGFKILDILLLEMLRIGWERKLRELANKVRGENLGRYTEEGYTEEGYTKEEIEKKADELISLLSSIEVEKLVQKPEMRIDFLQHRTKSLVELTNWRKIQDLLGPSLCGFLELTSFHLNIGSYEPSLDTRQRARDLPSNHFMLFLKEGCKCRYFDEAYRELMKARVFYFHTLSGTVFTYIPQKYGERKYVCDEVCDISQLQKNAYSKVYDELKKQMGIGEESHMEIVFEGNLLRPNDEMRYPDGSIFTVVIYGGEGEPEEDQPEEV